MKSFSLSAVKHIYPESTRDKFCMQYHTRDFQTASRSATVYIEKHKMLQTLLELTFIKIQEYHCVGKDGFNRVETTSFIKENESQLKKQGLFSWLFVEPVYTHWSRHPWVLSLEVDSIAFIDKNGAQMTTNYKNTDELQHEITKKFFPKHDQSGKENFLTMKTLNDILTFFITNEEKKKLEKSVALPANKKVKSKLIKI